MNAPGIFFQMGGFKRRAVMSNTQRAVTPGWSPGNAEFDRWNATCSETKQVKSAKHQARDRKGKGKQGGKFGRFSSRNSNSKYNLQRKNEQDLGHE